MNYYNQNPNMGAFVQPQQPQADIPWTQPLTDQERAMLKKKNPEFVLKSTDEEIAKAKCTHRDPKARATTLVQTETGSWKCTQCGEEFNFVDVPVETVQQYVASIIDILQTTKLMYVNMPPQAVTAYFNMIPFLEKLPKLYQIAQNAFRQSTGQQTLQGYGYSQDVWSQLSNAVANPGYGVPVAPNGYMYQQPMQPQYSYSQQPVYPQYNGFYADPSFNPVQQSPVQPQYYAQGPAQQAAAGPSPAGYTQETTQPQQQQTQPTNTQQVSGAPEQVVTNKQFSL